MQFDMWTLRLLDWFCLGANSVRAVELYMGLHIYNIYKWICQYFTIVHDFYTSRYLCFLPCAFVYPAFLVYSNCVLLRGHFIFKLGYKCATKSLWSWHIWVSSAILHLKPTSKLQTYCVYNSVTSILWDSPYYARPILTSWVCDINK